MASKPRRPIHALMALATLGVAGGGGYYFMSHKPEAKRRPAEKKATLVEVTEVRRTPTRVAVEGGGTVVASRVVELQPEVRGRVLRVGEGLRPGAVIEEGQLIARLDGRDYGVAVAQAKSQRAQAQAALELEKAQAAIAEEEVAIFEEANEPLPTKKYALREPQLESAQAGVNQAKASLMKAHLDLSRTRLSAPFDALVRSRGVSEGSRVTETTTLATVVGIDTWWIEAEIPKEMLRHLPDPRGTEVMVQVRDETAWGKGATRQGRVLEVGAEVVEGGRLVRILVAVDDPLGRATEGVPRMLLGSWVQVEIAGTEIDAFELPRSLVHDGRKVWVMGSDGTLDIREVTVAVRTRTSVFVREGLKDGDRVITSALPWPVQGMQLDLAPTGEKSAQVAPSADSP